MQSRQSIIQQVKTNIVDNFKKESRLSERAKALLTALGLKEDSNETHKENLVSFSTRYLDILSNYQNRINTILSRPPKLLDETYLQKIVGSTQHGFKATANTPDPPPVEDPERTFLAYLNQRIQNNDKEVKAKLITAAKEVCTQKITELIDHLKNNDKVEGQSLILQAFEADISIAWVQHWGQVLKLDEKGDDPTLLSFPTLGEKRKQREDSPPPQERAKGTPRKASTKPNRKERTSVSQQQQQQQLRRRLWGVQQNKKKRGPSKSGKKRSNKRREPSNEKKDRKREKRKPQRKQQHQPGRASTPQTGATTSGPPSKSWNSSNPPRDILQARGRGRYRP